MAKLWLIGGTSESVALAQELHLHHIPVIVTVTTLPACHNYPPSPTLWVEKLRFTCDEQLQHWISASEISGILDASHPFATEISERAMRVGKALNLSYLRFERADVTTLPSAYITELNSDINALSLEVLQGQRVLLTVGSQRLAQFAQWHRCADLFARILPSEMAIKLAYQAGFRRDRLIALQPPVSVELETALWRHWKISLVITKASGYAGGEDIKRQVADRLQIPLLVLKRPQIEYPWKTQSVITAVHFGHQVTTPSPHPSSVELP